MADFMAYIKPDGVESDIGDGDIVKAIPEKISMRLWAEKLIRGIHPYTELFPFNRELYLKFYRRIKVYTLSRKAKNIVDPEPSANFRDARKNAPAWVIHKDQAILPLSKYDIEFIYEEIRKHYDIDQICAAFVDLPFYRVYPWGTEDVQKFFVFHVPDDEFENDQEIMEIAKPEVLGRTLKFQYRIDYKSMDLPKEKDEKVKTLHSQNANKPSFLRSFGKEVIQKKWQP